MIAEQKLNMIQQISSLPEDLVQEAQDVLNNFLSKKKKNGKARKKQTYEERLKELEELAAKYLTEKEDFEAYMQDFEESTQDRPQPFRED